MANPGLTAEKAQFYYNLVRDAGSLKAASQRSGIPYSTIQNGLGAACALLGLPDPRTSGHAVRAMQARGTAPAAHAAQTDPPPLLAAFTPPALPSADEPIEALVERRIADFRRKQAAASARQWMRFKVNDTLPFALAFVGDPHVDDDGCDIGRLKAHMDTIERTPGMLGVGMGDWTNNWRGSLSRIWAQQRTSECDAWRLAEWVLRYKSWMLLLRGNHDMWSGAGDPLKWIADGGSPMVDWEAKFVVACGGAEWRINAAHNFPGHSQWNKLHGPMKRARFGAQEADLYVAGHLHTFALAEEQDESTGKTFWLARCRGYKVMDQYATVLGYGQAQDTGHSIVAVCSPLTGKMKCLSDVEEASDYLTFLRAKAAGGKRVA